MAFSSLQDLDAAREAVAFIFNIPESLVQLVIDARHRQLPGVDFKDIEQLAQVAETLAKNPRLQEELRGKMQEVDSCRALAPESAMSTVTATVTAPEGAAAALDAVPEVAQSKNELRQRHVAESEPGNVSGDTYHTDEPVEHREGIASHHNSRWSAAAPNLMNTPASAGKENYPIGKRAEYAFDESADKENSGSDGDESMAGRDINLASRVRELKALNRKLKVRKLCRACRKVELGDSGVTYLPCGHFIFCQDCSETFDACPACGRKVLAVVTTFLS